MTTRYLFLDIDGVLNSYPWAEMREKEPGAVKPVLLNELDWLCVHRLHILVRHLQPCRIVISSSWRLIKPLNFLQNFLNGYGFLYPEQIIDKTPRSNDARGFEIQAWMDQNLVKEDQIVILDDDQDMVHLKHRLVQPSFYVGGLLDSHVNEALGLFGLPPVEGPVHEHHPWHPYDAVWVPDLEAQGPEFPEA